MNLCLLEHDPLRAKIIRRHVESLGHSVRDIAFPPDGELMHEPDAVSAVVVADLTGMTRLPQHHVECIRRCFPRAISILLLRPEQTMNAEVALANGVGAVLREPFRLEDLDIQLAMCTNRP
ncbi:MAG: hypothetical protein PHR35_04925 [Kiritimatiellae bacterium]|nr:hypothetical protein [Kiritimatiellia bacterium]